MGAEGEWVSARRMANCPTCAGLPRYVARFDRFVCVSCRTWTDEPCGCDETDCPFPKSPDRPSSEDLAEAEEVVTP